MDSASTDFLGSTGVHGIMFESSQLQNPVLLDVVFSDDCFAAEEYVAAIEAACSKYDIDYMNRVTCIIGDNAAINDKIARLLALPRAKCIAHALNLVVKAITSKFPGFVTLVTMMHGVIFAGGTKKRAKVLRSLGIDTTKLRCCETRWSSTLEVCSYLLSPSVHDAAKTNFRVIREWLVALRNHKIAKRTDENSAVDKALEMEDIFFDHNGQQNIVDQKDGSVQFHDGDSDDNSSVPTAFHSAMIAECAEAELMMVSSLTSRIPMLITMACATIRNVDPSFIEQLCDLGLFLRTSKKPAYSEHLVKECMERSEKSLVRGCEQIVVKKYSAMVISALHLGMLKFQKHVDVAIGMLRRRFAFDPRNSPPEFIAPRGSMSMRDSIQGFFGCLPEEATHALIVEYAMYREAHVSMLMKQKEVSMSEFWNTMQKRFPMLSKVGLFWAEMPTSSVAMERGFGVLRSMCTAQRMGMKEETIKAELMFRINSWILR